MFNAKIFANRLKAVRSQKNISQAELAKVAGVSAATISSYENPNGAKVPTLDKASAIATHLGVTLDYLCGEDTAAASIVDFDIDLYLRSLVIVLSETMTDFTKYETNYGNAKGDIYISNYAIIGFITKFKDLLTVYRNGTLSEDLYITCVEKLISDIKENFTIDYCAVLSYEESRNVYMQLLNAVEVIIASGDKIAAPWLTNEPVNGYNEKEVTLFLTEKDIKKLGGDPNAQHNQKQE